MSMSMLKTIFTIHKSSIILNWQKKPIEDLSADEIEWNNSSQDQDSSRKSMPRLKFDKSHVLLIIWHRETDLQINGNIFIWHLSNILKTRWSCLEFWWRIKNLTWDKFSSCGVSSHQFFLTNAVNFFYGVILMRWIDTLIAHHQILQLCVTCEHQHT